MRILVTGANGFIGGYLVAHLLALGHEVTCCVRDRPTTKQRFPLATVIGCDFNHDIGVNDWFPRLNAIDAVINCAGVLTASRAQDIDKIHYTTPLALFTACSQLNIKRVIQISALGIADGPDLPYVHTKGKLDDALLKMKLSSCILRPSLVYANGAYGGTALMRALASLPFAIPLPGSGEARFQPIAMFDLVKVISHFLETDDQGIIDVVGPEPVSLKQLLIALRQWLGFRSAKTYKVPAWLIKPLAQLAYLFSRGPFNSASYQMTMHENIADYEPLRKRLNFELSPFPKGLNFYPSQTQDRWHARLYFLRPLLKYSLVFLWIFSGIIPLLGFNQQAENLLAAFGFSAQLIPTIKIASCLWDLFLGLALVFSFKNKFIAALQFLTVTTYTLLATIALTPLWLDPLAPLLKNIPILVSILIWSAIEDMR